MKNKRQVATVFSDGRTIIGSSDVIRWDDVMSIQGHDVQVSKAVELGLKHNLELAQKLEKDLKSKTGLLLTFPMMMLMDNLQRIESIGTGEKLLALVKPD